MIVTVCENVNFKKILKGYFCYIISIVSFFNQRPFLAPVSRKSLNFSGPFRAGDIILFVSSKRRRLKAGNYAVILTLIPFTTYEKMIFTQEAPLTRRWFSGRSCIRSNWNLRVNFKEGGNRSARRKPSKSG